jgi:hypothetical protein
MNGNPSCPYIRLSIDGTQYCKLAELTTETIDELRKELDDVKLAGVKLADERDRFRHALEQLEHFADSDRVRNIAHTALHLR